MCTAGARLSYVDSQILKITRRSISPGVLLDRETALELHRLTFLRHASAHHTPICILDGPDNHPSLAAVPGLQRADCVATMIINTIHLARNDASKARCTHVFISSGSSIALSGMDQ